MGRGVITMKTKDEYADNPTILFYDLAPGYYLEVKGITDQFVYFKAENKMHKAKLHYNEDGGCFFKWLAWRIHID